MPSNRSLLHRAFSAAAALLIALLLSGCQRKDQRSGMPDHPHIAVGVRMVDVTFYSVALHREMPYRVFLPAQIPPGHRLPIAYLLHGGGGDFRDWSNDSDVSQYSASGLILVMPEGESSYYVNSATKPKDRYEDYIVRDLIADAEGKFPAIADRDSRAIVGVSMGGFGAIKLALSHPQLFAFVGAISSALDVPSRPFSIRRISQWERFRSIFGPIGSPTERAADPFLFYQSASPSQAPYFYLAAGEQEALLGVNRHFADDLERRGFRCEFHTAPGGHDWGQWDEQIPALFANLKNHLGRSFSEVQP
jgi:putative tributyrin esterase